MRFAVEEQTRCRAVILVADTPGHFKPENVFFPFFIGDIRRTVPPVPNFFIRPNATSPVEHGKGVGFGEGERFVPHTEIPFGGHRVLFHREEEAIVEIFSFAFERRHGHATFVIVEDLHFEHRFNGLFFVDALKLHGTDLRSRDFAEEEVAVGVGKCVFLFAVGGENVFVFAAEEGGHGGDEFGLFAADVHENSGSVAADRDVGERNLHHIFAVADLIEIPFLATPLRMRERAVIFKHVVACPTAFYQNVTFFVQNGRGFGIFHLVACVTEFFPTDVCFFHMYSPFRWFFYYFTTFDR